MISPLDYLDYRRYLSDLSSELKGSSAGFSQRGFLQKAGIKSPSLFKQVIQGERNLTPDTTEKFIIALGLKENNAEFFRHLVGFTQAPTSRVKQRHYARMVELGEKSAVRIVGEEEFRFYEEWYLSPLRELAELRDWNDDWKALGKALYPPISATEARRSIALLEELGLLVKEGTRWRQTDRALSTGHQVTSLAVRSFHHKMLGLAADSLDPLSADQRHISGITLGLSEEGYRLIEKEIEAAEERILKIAEKDRGEKSRVVQLINALFPLAHLSAPSKGETL